MRSRRIHRAGLSTGLCLVLPFHRLDSSHAFRSGLQFTMTSSVPAKTAVFYRHRYEHEQQHLIVSPTSTISAGIMPSLQDPSSSLSSSSPMNSSEGGIHYEMLVQVVFRQLAALWVSTLCALVGMGGHLHDLFPASMHSYSSVPWFTPCIWGALSAVPLIYAHTWWLSQQHSLPAQRAQLRTNDLCDRMFGRRHYHPAQDAKNESPSTTNSTTSTVTVLCLVAALTGLTAGVEEIIFRVYAVGWLQHHPQIVTALGVTNTGNGVEWCSILAAAVVFGLVHTHPQHHRAENIHVMSQQFACAVWYSFLLSTTGSVMVPVMAHWLYDCHTLAASWHTSNTQQDYVAEHPTATLEDPVATLFFAFDEQHRGTLSHRDVQHAVAFLFLDDKDRPVAPTTHQVEAELYRFNRSPTAHDDDDDDDRVSLDDFRRLIYALHQNQHQQQLSLAPPIHHHYPTKCNHRATFKVQT